MKVDELVKELREANDPLLECKPFRWESLSHAADWLEGK